MRRLPDADPGALLIGHPFAVLGRGEDIRTAACALDLAAVPFSIRNTFGEHGRAEAELHRDFPFMDRVNAGRRHKASIFFLNADEMAPALHHMGTEILQGSYNIGYWAWELSTFPDAWLPALSFVDEIWAPSRFIQQAMAEKASCPVLWMPLAVEPASPARLRRADLKLPADRFLFLFFFDFRSYASRKNPWAAIRAFQAAFADGDARAGLVIKTNGMVDRPEEFQAFLASEEMRDPRIVLMDQVMDDQHIKELVRLCDAFVSLHRSEGFGRGLAEAMYMGKPVIGTGYSGNLDFMNELNSCLVDHVLVPVGPDAYPHGEGQLWADADVEMAAHFMRRLVDEPAFARAKGRRAAAYIRAFNGFAATGARYRRRLQKIGAV